MSEQQDRIYKVYRHTLPMQVSGKSNDMIYIGITCQKIENRWRKNGNGYKQCLYFYNAIQKYGWDNFNHEVLFEGMTKEEAEQKEIELIAFYKSNDSAFGYNIQSGGNVAVGKVRAKPVICVETQVVYESAVDAGRKLDISNATISSCCNGNNKIAGGYHWMFADEYSDKNVALLLERTKSKRCKQVLCVDNGKTYYSITEASLDTGISASCIGDCCSHQCNHAGGLRWLYLDDATNEKIDEVLNTKLYIRGEASVICVETKQVFDNSVRAAEYFSTTSSSIRACCRGVNKTAAGYHWMFLSDYTEEDAEKLLKLSKNKLSKKVIRLNDGKVYNTISEAALENGTFVTAISACCKGKNKSAGKFKDGTKLRWRYYEEATIA